MSKFEEPGASIPDPDDFDEGEAEIDPQLERRSAFSETLAKHGFSDILVLSRDRADDVFHDRRLEIIDYLAEHDPESIRAVANELEYDNGVVGQDLRKLAKLDIVEYENNGRAKAPRLKHCHVAIEPVVTTNKNGSNN